MFSIASAIYLNQPRLNEAKDATESRFPGFHLLSFFYTVGKQETVKWTVLCVTFVTKIGTLIGGGEENEKEKKRNAVRGKGNVKRDEIDEKQVSQWDKDFL